MSVMNVTIIPQRIIARVTGPGINTTAVINRSGAARVVLVGQQGPSGSTAASYTHTQSTALAIWTVAHNLNRKPSITVVDNLDARIEPDVTYLDANTVRITHAAALIGKVYCN